MLAVIPAACRLGAVAVRCLIEIRWQTPAVRWQFVGGQNAFQENVAEREGGDRRLAMRTGSLRTGFAAALNGGSDHSLAVAPFWLAAVAIPPGLLIPFAFAANIRFVGLGDARNNPQLSCVMARMRWPGNHAVSQDGAPARHWKVPCWKRRAGTTPRTMSASADACLRAASEMRP
jgi:hypothetical protein